MGAHGYEDQESTYRFGLNLRRQPEILGGFADDLLELARQAEECQPVSSHFAQEIRAVAELVRVTARDSEGWYPMFRGAHQRDVSRVEEPRKSRGVESRADVGRAVRDV